MSKWVTPKPLSPLPPGKTITKMEAIAMLRAGGYSLPKALATVAFMAWSAPSNQSTGDLITAAIWNQNVVANVQYLYDYRLGELISETTLSADTDSVSFTSIPQTYSHLLLRMFFALDTGSTYVAMNLNSLTGAYYDSGWGQQSFNSTYTTTYTVNQTAGRWANALSASIPNQNIEIYFPFYSDANLYKHWHVTGGAGMQYWFEGHGYYTNAAFAISQIDLDGAGSAKLRDLSRFQLYGLY